MPRGHIDYNISEAVISLKGIDDADVVLMLSGFQSVDSKGRLYFFDRFEQGIRRWEVSKLGTGSYPYIYYNTSDLGNGCVRFTPTSGVGSGNSYIRRAFYIPDVISVGLQFSLGMYQPDIAWHVYIQYVSGSNAYNFHYRIESSGTQLRYETATGYQDIAEIPPSIGVYAWTNIKLVANVRDGHTERVIVGQRQTDTNLNALTNATGLYGGILNIQFGAEDSAGSGDVYDLGYVAITLDEP